MQPSICINIWLLEDAVEHRKIKKYKERHGSKSHISGLRRAASTNAVCPTSSTAKSLKACGDTYLHIHVYIYMYMYLCIHTYVYCTYIYIYIYHTYTPEFMVICAYTYTYAYTYIRIRIHIHMHMHICIYICFFCLHLHVRIHIHIHIRVHIHVHVHIHIHVHTYAHLYYISFDPNKLKSTCHWHRRGFSIPPRRHVIMYPGASDGRQKLTIYPGPPAPLTWFPS